MAIVVLGERKKDRNTIERSLRQPFFGVQAPGTSDYTDVKNLTGLTWRAAGLYTSAHNGTSYVAFPTTSFNFYSAQNVERIQWTVQIQSTNSALDANFNCQSILNGDHDAWMISMAQALAAWMVANPGIEVQWRTLHEMDGNWYPWGALSNYNGNTGLLLNQAWIHCFNIVKQYCPQAKMTWCPDSYSTSTNSTLLDAAYPGNQYIDYLGVDAYNWGPSSLGAHGWRTPSQMFSQTKTWFDSKGLPAIICETGCPFAPAGSFADETGDKNAWIASLATYCAAWGSLEGVFWEQNTNKDNVRINRLRNVDNWHYPTNGYGADTVGTYSDHSADAFATAFASW